MPEIAHQSIITNGYLFDEEAIDYFVDNKLNQIQITLDGIGKAHDQTRCLKNSDESTFDRIYRNIRLIAEKCRTPTYISGVNVDKQSFTKFLDVYAAIKRDFPDNKRIKVYPGLIKADDGNRLLIKFIVLSVGRKARTLFITTSERIRPGCFP